MNESHPITPSADNPSAPPFKDRSGALVVFGVLTIGLGVCCGLMVLLMFVGQAMSAQLPNAPTTSFAMMLPGLLVYGGLAAALVWLGIGSIQARRWARALLLIFSWSWLVVGVISTALMTSIYPKILGGINLNRPAGQPAIPAPTIAVMMVVMALILGFIFILLPTVWVFFYGSRHVKATCEARNPAPCWTDACPLPLLAVSLWLWFSAPMCLLMPTAYDGFAPFFGAVIHGILGDLYYLAIAAFMAWAAWRLYRRDARAWWVLLVSLVLLFASGLLTFARHDLGEMYRLMGYPEAQIELIQKSGILTGNFMAWMIAGWAAPLFGYLLYVKRYLPVKR